MERDIHLEGGRILHAYDTGPTGPDELAVMWHHGTPNVGTPPAPLFPASEPHNIRWIAYDRPGYGGSAPREGRDVASAAADAAIVADALGVGRFAVLGHSGGGPHALACAALLSDRVPAAVAISGPAPIDADGLDWFKGMAPSAEASLRAACAGREAKERHAAAAGDDPSMFTAADQAALAGEWSWFIPVVQAALADGIGGLVDDDLATVAPWGFDASEISVPTLVIHGARDQLIPSSHGHWVADRCAAAELWIGPGDGHISILSRGPEAVAWLREVTT